jgi:hypothetical protein
MEPTTSSDVANGEITWGKGSTSLTVRLHLTIHAKLGQLGVMVSVVEIIRASMLWFLIQVARQSDYDQ